MWEAEWFWVAWAGADYLGCVDGWNGFGVAWTVGDYLGCVDG